MGNVRCAGLLGVGSTTHDSHTGDSGAGYHCAIGGWAVVEQLGAWPEGLLWVNFCRRTSRPPWKNLIEDRTPARPHAGAWISQPQGKLDAGGWLGPAQSGDLGHGTPGERRLPPAVRFKYWWGHSGGRDARF
jgi:hypothetical protein